ncbi:hypothetical protein KQX54_007778 [Cotesia glomerata]|uniref:Uncharacterized protein n=1 Tax=Cotesia glomerata TaxID=32391 RepID=A0AAV7ITW9_COTGL|nr:hypothetical protein KQX54_007778 [Cotesia glomerata]
MEILIRKFCLVANGDSKCIVETKYLFKLGGNDLLVPLGLEERKGDLVYVRSDAANMNRLSLLASDDSPKNLKELNAGGKSRIKTLTISKYNPQILEKKNVNQQTKPKKTSNGTKTAPTLNTASIYRNLLPGGSGMTSNVSQTDMETRIKVLDSNSGSEDGDDNLERPGNQEVSSAEVSPASQPPEGDSVEASDEDSLTRRSTTDDSGRNRQSTRGPIRVNRRTGLRKNLKSGVRPRRHVDSSVQRKRCPKTSVSSKQIKRNLEEYPLLKDVIEMENGVAMRTIGNLKIENGKLGDILVKDTLRRRADCLMHALWPDDQMKRMYVKVPVDAVDAVVPTSVDRQNIEDVCLFLQRKREIQYFDGGIDDIKVWLKKWMSELFNQTRSKLKRKLKAQQAAE